ncbi:MAG TPA: hypothetical protein VI306_26070 [Pyrinomonadaceae bacterium]
MISYHLDDLGWYQFEALIKSLLKAEAGMSVELWGGPTARDVFANSSLFPHKKNQQVHLSSKPNLFKGHTQRLLNHETQFFQRLK